MPPVATDVQSPSNIPTQLSRGDDQGWQLGYVSPNAGGYTEKGAFFGQTPAAQPTSSGNVHTVAAGATTTVFTNTTFDGSIGSTAYTVGDIVKALKTLGLIAS